MLKRIKSLRVCVCVCPYLFYYGMMQAILNVQVNRIKPLWAGFAEAFDVYPKQCIY